MPSATDANAGNGKYGTCCTENDIWKANNISTAFTMHSCDVKEQTRCEGADKEYTETYGVETESDKLSVGIVTHGAYTTNIGSRVYLMRGEDRYKMFHLKTRSGSTVRPPWKTGCHL